MVIITIILNAGMLLWACKASSVEELAKGDKSVLRQTDLLQSFDEAIINAVTAIIQTQEYFTQDTWMAVLQKGKICKPKQVTRVMIQTQ